LVMLLGGQVWWPVTQLWLFWVAPILGALLAGFVHLWLSGEDVPAPAAKADAPPPPPPVEAKADKAA
jgi:hypothetical protein